MGNVSRYEQRGVSSSKTEVHAAVEKLDKGLFPGAFCKILPDYLGHDPEYCNIQHADGAGTKASLAYLVWKLTGDISVWKGIICDSLFMNLDDVACAGALGPFLVSLSIGRNKALIPGEVIKALIEGCQEVCDMLTGYGIRCVFTGGETADLGDLVRTIVVDNTVTVRLPREDVIDAGNIRKDAYIVGFSSTGQTPWESGPNSGIGSNGLTNARHDVLAPLHRSHTETFAPETREYLIYCGDYQLSDLLPGDPRFTIASALLSPTRTYLPLINRLIGYVGRENILGLIHCSGGGQTKIGKFGPKGIQYVKDNLFPVPPLFQMLQKVRNLPIRQMFESYNMGHRLEAVVPDMETAKRCMRAAQADLVEARIIGKTVPNDNPDQRKVVIKTENSYETYNF